MSIKKITQIATLTALLIALVLVTPPIIIAGIPFSLQPFIIALIALIFDWKTTLSIIALYILIGFLGLPVFSGGKNGAAIIASGTLGFIIGFIPYGFILSSIKHISKKHTLYSIVVTISLSLLSLIALYSFGYLYFQYKFNFSLLVFSTTMFPFFIADILKVSVAYSIAISVKPLIRTLKK